MAKKGRTKEAGFDRIPFRMHPRVFAALGADLVTNDVVAVIELVKNSYDAFAENVWLRFREDSSGLPYLEIEDDGTGMTRDIIQDVWCLVATPFKAENPKAKSGKKTRRVAGEKGLGRLSVARLGTRLNMLTQAPNTACWELAVDWSEVAAGEDLSDCFAKCRKYPGTSPFQRSGALIRIRGLKSLWEESQIADLEDNLARLISPFSDFGDFNVFLSRPGGEEIEEVRIQAPAFLSKPKYAIQGRADGKGNVKARYAFTPVGEGKARSKQVKDRGKYNFGVSSVATVARPWIIAGPPSGDGSYIPGNCSSRVPYTFSVWPTVKFWLYEQRGVPLPDTACLLTDGKFAKTELFVLDHEAVVSGFSSIRTSRRARRSPSTPSAPQCSPRRICFP